MVDQLQVPLVLLCLILAYLTGVMTVVGAALIGSRPHRDGPVILVMVRRKKGEGTGDSVPKSNIIHETQAVPSQATFSTRAQSEEELQEEIAERLRARHGLG